MDKMKNWAFQVGHVKRIRDRQDGRKKDGNGAGEEKKYYIKAKKERVEIDRVVPHQ